MLFLIWLVVIVIGLVVYLRKVYSRFSKYGVKCLKPVPFLGNTGDVALQKCHVGEDVQNLYQAFPDERFVGRFEMMRPVVVIRDLDLIKHVTVKDFEHFLDHRTMVDETVDPLFGRNLFSFKGQEWKDMRHAFNPEPSVHRRQDARHGVIHDGSGYIDIESKDLATRYTNDVIASCAFGLKLDSHDDSENEFYLHGKATAHFGFRRILVYLGYSSFPSLMKKLNFKFIGSDASEYFKSIFFNTILERERNMTFRPDMIHLLVEAKKGNLKHDHSTTHTNDAGFATTEESDIGQRSVNRSWSDTDLIAQAVLFFIAGFETASSAMAFLLYELAMNPDVQDRLVQEFRDNEERNGKFDYNSMQDLKYLDMVVSEILRLWPPGVGIDRMCVKNYNLGKPNDDAKEDYILKKGKLILVPTWAIHRDPNYYPDPEKFDPERFSEQNRVNIKPYTYIPFGSGPRNCIGSRFALSELKVMLYHLLLQFEVSPSEKTRVPAKLMPSAFTLSMEGGHWVRFKSRAP